ncbi:hypothetical protein [Microbulbifer epialgicus]|uniref:Uncharacterized protein n=1 Tax=Microbulbifer epialgicus TaxID=393907 RepID=A0ABV4P3I6_9GAMM
MVFGVISNSVERGFYYALLQGTRKLLIPVRKLHTKAHWVIKGCVLGKPAINPGDDTTGIDEVCAPLAHIQRVLVIWGSGPVGHPTDGRHQFQ